MRPLDSFGLIKKMRNQLVGKIVLSIPHTGTRTLMEAFGWPHFHVYGRIHPEFVGFARDTVLACPLREPRAVWQSWVKRWETDTGAVDLGLFIHQWEFLEEFDKEYDIFYIPLDCPGCGLSGKSQEMLDILSKRLDEELKVDFSKLVGHYGDDVKTDHPEPDWDYIYNLPFVKRFYVA